MVKELLPQISEAYKTFGLYLTQVDNCVSPNLITLHYNLHNIDRLQEAKRKLQMVSAMLHYDMEFKKSEVAHFAIIIPVKENRTVCFNDEKYKSVFDKPFTIFAGIDNNNKPVGVHLTKSPHILIAGETGSGKSVMLNTAICSLLKTSNKDNIEFFMIDTKLIGLSTYKRLNKNCHFITEVELAIECLENVCKLIKDRYSIMEKYEMEQLPSDYKRIVIVIDELSDVMFESKGLIEKYLVKIARLGRACNINLIVATQRPVVKNLTGEIKANMSCRFGLKVASVRDSINIVDYGGCEKLIGNGDCLLKAQTVKGLIRIQCPFTTKEEILKCIEDFNGGINEKGSIKDN